MVALIREPPRDDGPGAPDLAALEPGRGRRVGDRAASRAAAAIARRPGSRPSESIDEIIDFLHREFVASTDGRDGRCRRGRRRPVGVVLVDKPAGPSSFALVAELRRRTGARTGHTGTLDPFATGPAGSVVRGGDRLAPCFVGLDKRYVTDVDLTATTSTGDREGEIVERHEPPPRDELDEALARLRGEIELPIPAASAVEIGGERAYRLAGAAIDGGDAAAALAGLRARRHRVYRTAPCDSSCMSAPGHTCGRSPRPSAATARPCDELRSVRSVSRRPIPRRLLAVSDVLGTAARGRASRRVPDRGRARARVLALEGDAREGRARPGRARAAASRGRDRHLRRRPPRSPRGAASRARRPGCVPTAVTFHPHPRVVLGNQVDLLCTIERRLELLAEPASRRRSSSSSRRRSPPWSRRVRRGVPRGDRRRDRRCRRGLPVRAPQRGRPRHDPGARPRGPGRADRRRGLVDPHQDARTSR